MATTTDEVTGVAMMKYRVPGVRQWAVAWGRLVSIPKP
jgi:hypothetical protein